MKLNKAKWNEARIQIETSIREMKSRKRESHQPRWSHGPDDWELASLKYRAKHLYLLRYEMRKFNRVYVPEGPRMTAYINSFLITEELGQTA